MSKHYLRRVLPTADADLDNLEQYIVEQCAAPLTAARQFELLYKTLDWLEQYAELPAVMFRFPSNMERSCGQYHSERKWQSYIP